MSTELNEAEGQPQPKWQPLTAIQRRVLGVLVEKAKTTPDGYPLSLNALVSGCKQKSNRSPQMNPAPDDVEEALDQLRALGAIGEVHGGGRVIKYRHYMKDWLGVSGTELAVMAELMLRGAQTVGELRGRAARMASGQLSDIGALRPVLQSLIDTGLVISLTSEGRGQIVSHALYQPNELEKVRRLAGNSESAAAPVARSSGAATPGSPSVPSSPAVPVTESPPAVAASTMQDHSEVEQLRGEVSQLRAEIARLAKEVEDIWANLR